MAIKNLMEDIVKSVAKEVLKKENDIPKTPEYEQDIIAYVLNRVPPRYITSERGVIHGKLESRFLFQQRTDILFLVHEAIQNFKSRRLTSTHLDYTGMAKQQWFLPHILGEVLEETTFSVVPDTEVTLLYEGKPAQMVDEGWMNPFLTNKATMGYYHFWPAFIEEKMDAKNPIPFSIRFENEKFVPKEIEFTLKVQENANFYESRVIPIALLNIKEGVDISFLYE